MADRDMTNPIPLLRAALRLSDADLRHTVEAIVRRAEAPAPAPGPETREQAPGVLVLHIVDAKPSGRHSRYHRGTCTCGWRGPNRNRRRDALDDAGIHAQTALRAPVDGGAGTKETR